MTAAREQVHKLVAENAVMVFAKRTCPYCHATRATLDGLHAKYGLLELDTIPDGRVIQDILEEETGQRTVPNIFIKGKSIGGNSDLQAKKKELPQILKAAGAL